ncbi:S1/P1 nuclease [Lacimicrobium alkaliphilum]|uniref:Endonuclease n=1 Tax=Lacimicrobium alkaliphilum TaxID=1526571 RepID=A0ABQ1RIR0_9ALTE|nr:S1/P1 nuclease [Lacimicrobium alkaliphilum]GGD67940.1 hypothetical protein GCM10011357_23800 [Lacimicrobium alkaliphilum]
MRHQVLEVSVVFIGLIIMLWGNNADAWGEKGHRAVAQAAYAKLRPQAKQAADTLLAAKDFGSLADAAVWPDLVRDAKLPQYSHTGPWHYVNLAQSATSFNRSRDCPKSCAVIALEQMQKQLKHADQQKRAEALAFIVHLVADLHQPLHVSYGHDRGGNDYPVKVGKERFSLHYYWDVYVLRNAGSARQLAGYLVSRQGLAQIKRQQVASVSQWLNESYAITRRIYSRKPHSISPAAFQQDQKQALERLALAAARLAYLLNNQLSD